MANKKYIPIIKKGETGKVFLESILLIEQNLRQMVIHTEQETHFLYGKLDELEKYLDKSFLKCHHSCIINLEKVIRMKEQTIYFENGHQVTMGRTTFQFTSQQFAKYMQQHNLLQNEYTNFHI